MKFESKLITPQFEKSHIKDILKAGGINVSEVHSVKQYVKGVIEVKFKNGNYKIIKTKV